MTTKTKNTILVILVVLTATLIPALIFSKWLEAVIFHLSHLTIRPQFKRQYHNIMPTICREISGIVFFFGISFMLPIELSLMSAIPINYLIGWIGHVKATSDYYENKCYKLKDKLTDPKVVMEKKCAKAKLSERDTKIAIMYYCDRKTPKDIWLWLCENKDYEDVEWDYVYTLLNRISKKLNKIK